MLPHPSSTTMAVTTEERAEREATMAVTTEERAEREATTAHNLLLDPSSCNLL